MAVVTWSLSANAGTRRPLNAWGMREATVTFRSLDVDEFTCVIVGDVFTACPLAYNDLLDLYRDNVHWWQGRVTDITAAGGRGEYWAITASNAVWHLGRTLMQQATACYDADCHKIGTVKTSKVVLFQDEITGNPITTGAQIAAALTYALLQGVAIAAGETPPFVTVPCETVREQTVLDVIRRCVQFTPDAVSYCDYSGGTPLLSVKQRAALTVVSLDLADKDLVREFTCRKRSDLIPSGVRFNYLGVRTCPLDVGAGCVDPVTGAVNTTGSPIAGSGDGQGMKITQDFAGLPDLPGGIVATIDLAQMTESESETVPIGLAGLYYLSLLTPQYQGSLTLKEVNCSGLLRPGKVVNLANGHAEWATMKGVVQEVEERLQSGETVVTFGPPEHLGPQDFVAMLELARRRPLVQDAFAKVRPPGNPDTPNCDAGKDPRAKDLANKVGGNRAALLKSLNGTPDAETGEGELATLLPRQALQVCVDGVATTIYVYSPQV